MKKKFYVFIFQDLMLGDDASQLRHMLELSYPMENGIVRNWEEMQHIWDYTFGKTKLNIDPTECKILLTEPPMNPARNREKLIEVSNNLANNGEDLPASAKILLASAVLPPFLITFIALFAPLMVLLPFDTPIIGFAMASPT